MLLMQLQLLKENHLDIKVRNNLLYASTKAGLAFSNTKTAAAHSMSYPLTINFGVPHGIASSISLLPLLEINKKLIKEPLEMICMRNELTYDELIIKIKNIPNNILPFTLNELGIYEKELPKLVEESFTKGRMENNIVDLSIEQIHSIFEKIF